MFVISRHVPLHIELEFLLNSTKWADLTFVVLTTIGESVHVGLPVFGAGCPRFVRSAATAVRRASRSVFNTLFPTVAIRNSFLALFATYW